MTNPISQGSAPMVDDLHGLRPSEVTEHLRRVGGLRGVANTEVSHCSRGADQARAAQSSKLPTARASSAEINTLALYAATEALRATPMHQRSEQFAELSGSIIAPMSDAWLYDEALWLVDLMGIQCTGTSRQSALSDWINTASARVQRRASDGRPDCPYNGQLPAPAKR
ncbi:hypothetical protein [Tritonibacter mobilis]|uniref:hypothetical protein n=2 Tax=Tritonibacter mobilis TaxID=379347 RepID=UPI000806B4B5|nr:hypothetical protein [Tritonibacter mobilis]GLP87075.1 hypothetical protein GCM10007921_26350 [Tritonibacter mobilis]SDW49433.1 hypothetical protein SAMN05444385_102403 [Tritonibacter mobilis]